MHSKPDITKERLAGWDSYLNKTPNEIIENIYQYSDETSKRMRAWYWKSVKTKRWTSLTIRAWAFLFLILGTTFPIFAALQEKTEEKLLLTQLAVAFLAVAGLSQLADRVFGWSSGWMRYITTVTTMENLTQAFELEWARYLVSKSDALDINDAKALFDLAKGLEQELVKLQADETTKWVADFNTGISLLETTVKAQREETDKKLDAIKTSLTAQQTANKADEKLKVAGSLEILLTFRAEIKTVKIGLDSEAPIDFLGNYWSRLEVSPGRHVIKVLTNTAPVRAIERTVEIKADSITKLEILTGE